jgi:hypothetical protein
VADDVFDDDSSGPSVQQLANRTHATAFLREIADWQQAARDSSVTLQQVSADLVRWERHTKSHNSKLAVLRHVKKQLTKLMR